MPFFRGADPVADYHAHDREQQKWLDSLPKCAECDHPIQDDECFELEVGVLICPECLNDNHRRRTDELIKD